MKTTSWALDTQPVRLEGYGITDSKFFVWNLHSMYYLPYPFIPMGPHMKRLLMRGRRLLQVKHLPYYFVCDGTKGGRNPCPVLGNQICSQPVSRRLNFPLSLSQYLIAKLLKGKQWGSFRSGVDIVFSQKSQVCS